MEIDKTKPTFKRYEAVKKVWAGARLADWVRTWLGRSRTSDKPFITKKTR